MTTLETLVILVRIAGIGQICMMVVFMLTVPGALRWADTLRAMPKLHRQIHTAYSKYAMFTGIGLGAFSAIFPEDIASGAGLGQAVALFTGLFWAGRLLLQKLYDTRPYLTTPLLRAGYHTLTVIFTLLTTLYLWVGTYRI